jgi:hypothetical protein
MKGQAETPKLLDQVRNVLRLHHYSIHTERSYVDWIIETAMIYTHVVKRGGQGVPSPLDDLP